MRVIICLISSICSAIIGLFMLRVLLNRCMPYPYALIVKKRFFICGHAHVRMCMQMHQHAQIPAEDALYPLKECAFNGQKYVVIAKKWSFFDVLLCIPKKDLPMKHAHDLLQQQTLPACLIDGQHHVLETNDAFNALANVTNIIDQQHIRHYISNWPWTESISIRHNDFLLKFAHKRFKTSHDDTLLKKDVHSYARLNYVVPLRGAQQMLLVFMIEDSPYMSSPWLSRVEHQMIQMMPYPLCVIDHDGCIHAMNARFQVEFSKHIVESSQSNIQDFFNLHEETHDTDRVLGMTRITLTDQRTQKIFPAWVGQALWHHSLPQKSQRFFLFIGAYTQRESSVSRNLQALGQLTSSIAHDFNNILTALLGCCDLALEKPGIKEIRLIKDNAQRAINLTQQLLLFARKDRMECQPINLSKHLRDLHAFLEHLIGANISFKFTQDRRLKKIMGVPAEIDQIIVNLIVNARDAMNNGGLIHMNAVKHETEFAIETWNATLPAGAYILIEIEDNGIGISPAMQKKIFEPYFSTKSPGEGTGIGLATVLEVMHRLQGGISIESKVGYGTKFSLYFPCFKGRVPQEEDVKEIEEMKTSSFDAQNIHILLVEDEDMIRQLTVRTLQNKGFQVSEASDGKTAYQILGQVQKKIDLLITDVILPHMNGCLLAQHALKLCPDLKILFLSGYTQETIGKQWPQNMPMPDFLPKPFTLKALLEKVYAITVI